jgi:hypothetical protein
LLGEPSNIIVLCSTINGLLESDARWAELARERGWKLTAGQESNQVPIWDVNLNGWYLLDDQFGKKRLTAYSEPAF